MDETNAVLNDTEEFITNVLGKIHLPPEVNKQRLELSERLRKLLKKDVAPAFKPRLDPPTEIIVEELYDDVAAGVADNEGTAETDVQEMYDDVKQLEEPEENYDDVVGATSMVAEPTEIYDDVADQSQPTPVLDMQHVADLKKAADIQGTVYKGQLDKYKTRGITLVSRWQQRHCVLTPLALYYYANLSAKQKGTIILAGSGCVLRKGSPSYPDMKDGKMCFEIGDHERNYLFKVENQEEVDIWIGHIKSALKTKLSEKDISFIRGQSKKVAEEKSEQKKEKTKEKDKDKKKTGEEKIEEQTEPEELYELMDNYAKNENSSSSNETASIQEELYEETDQFSSVKETSSSSNGPPTLPSRQPEVVEEEFDEPTEVEDYEFPDVGTKPPAVSVEIQEDYELPGLKPKSSATASQRQPPKSPALPPRNTSLQDGPSLPPRPGNSSVQPAKSPPSIPTRTTPKATPDSLKPPPGQVEPSTPASPAKKPEVVPNPSPTPPVIRMKPTKGEQFDYAKVYVAMWNCDADADDDLSFSRGNQLYIREKIPNSDWWVASLMDSPDIRVGLVPRNYIMPAYELHVSTKVGTVFELIYELMVIHKVRRLLPTGSRGRTSSVTMQLRAFNMELGSTVCR